MLPRDARWAWGSPPSATVRLVTSKGLMARGLETYGQ